MKLEIKRKVPIRKRLCLYCGEERIGYEVTFHQINNNSQTLGMCKQCIMEMSYRMNEIIANEVTKND